MIYITPFVKLSTKLGVVGWGYFLYPTKKKRNSKIFPLSFPFNAKMLIIIKYYVLIKSRQKNKRGIDEYLCFPCVGTKHTKVNGKRVLGVFIQWYCLRGIPSMFCNGNVPKRYVFVM